MKEIVFDRNDYESYKDFYVQLYKELNGKSFGDWQAYENLNYDASMLDEFLWYNNDKKVKFVFQNFDLEKIKEEKIYDDYEYGIIFKVFDRVVSEYETFTMEIIKEEK